MVFLKISGYFFSMKTIIFSTEVLCGWEHCLLLRMKTTNSSRISRLILTDTIIIFKMQNELCIDLKVELKQTFQSYIPWRLHDSRNCLDCNCF